MTSGRPKISKRFPLSEQYHPDWVLAGISSSLMHLCWRCSLGRSWASTIFVQSAAASHVHEASIKVSAVCLERRYGAIHAASFQLVTTLSRR